MDEGGENTARITYRIMAPKLRASLWIGNFKITQIRNIILFMFHII